MAYNRSSGRISCRAASWIRLAFSLTSRLARAPCRPANNRASCRSASTCSPDLASDDIATCNAWISVHSSHLLQIGVPPATDPFIDFGNAPLTILDLHFPHESGDCVTFAESQTFKRVHDRDRNYSQYQTMMVVMGPSQLVCQTVREHPECMWARVQTTVASGLTCSTGPPRLEIKAVLVSA